MILLACIVTVSAVLFIHLGLSETIQRIIHLKVQPLNCSKCLSFWSVLLVLLYHRYNLLYSVGVSFISAYAALWMELSLGLLSNLYDKLYGKIYTTEEGQAHKDD